MSKVTKSLRFGVGSEHAGFTYSRTALAVMLALGAAFLLDFLDDHLTSAQRAERQLRLPVLGHIPLVPSDTSPLLTTLSPDSPVAESYRSLRANLGFAAMDGAL